MDLPLGVPDPLFVHQLALDLGKSVQELGECMSAHELCVLWPEYYATRARMRASDEAKQAGQRY